MAAETRTGFQAKQRSNAADRVRRAASRRDWLAGIVLGLLVGGFFAWVFGSGHEDVVAGWRWLWFVGGGLALGLPLAAIGGLRWLRLLVWWGPG